MHFQPKTFLSAENVHQRAKIQSSSDAEQDATTDGDVGEYGAQYYNRNNNGWKIKKYFWPAKTTRNVEKHMIKQLNT